MKLGTLLIIAMLAALVVIVGGLVLLGIIVSNCDKIAQEAGGIAAEVEKGYQESKNE